jgi:hypothetical protein
MSNKKYQWQGEPVSVIFGYCVVAANQEKPLWWYNYECALDRDTKSCICVIKVILKTGETFLLANHFGIGVHKLLNGGWPNYQHFSIDGNFSTSSPDPWQLKFDLEGFEDHESKRRIWQKENFPDEFERMERLRMSMQNLQKQIKD